MKAVEFEEQTRGTSHGKDGDELPWKTLKNAFPTLPSSGGGVWVVEWKQIVVFCCERKRGHVTPRRPSETQEKSKIRGSCADSIRR